MKNLKAKIAGLLWRCCSDLTPEEVKANAEYVREHTWPKLEEVLDKRIDGWIQSGSRKIATIK